MASATTITTTTMMLSAAAAMAMYSLLSVCWVCFVKCVGALSSNHIANFLCWCPFEFVAACQSIATSSYSSYSHECPKRFMIRSFDSFGSSMYKWKSCSDGTYTSYLLRCQMNEILTFKPRNLTAFLWLWKCLSALNKCILISNFINLNDFWFEILKICFLFFCRLFSKYFKHRGLMKF